VIPINAVKSSYGSESKGELSRWYCEAVKQDARGARRKMDFYKIICDKANDL
jgi:hypothetical protein